MKIICIARNYAQHAKELDHETTPVPVFFLKPDSAILQNGKPFFLPDFSNDIQHEIELVVRIDRLGKNIAKRFAYRYYSEITLGIDFTARDLQREAIKCGQPWEIAKAFDASAVVGDYVRKENLGMDVPLAFELKKNGQLVQEGSSSQMLFTIDEIIGYVSQFITLKIGDLIYTGTPARVGKVEIGDRLQGFLNGRKLLDFEVC